MLSATRPHPPAAEASLRRCIRDSPPEANRPAAKAEPPVTWRVLVSPGSRRSLRQQQVLAQAARSVQLDGLTVARTT
jgi:hypothetical protein